ncbi:MAG TPA: OmpA family protein [Elusimicrobiota bacterium]|nr:OmpA family protein [Elusimicrobiota bacterium]
MIHTLFNRMMSSEEDNPLWLVVLCDMMTNLMLFFLIMYGFTRQPEEARKAMLQAVEDRFRGEEKKTATEQKAETVLQKIQEEDVSQMLKNKNVAQVELSEQRIRVTLTNPVLFVSGEAVLGDKAKKDIRSLAMILAKIPNPIIVEGYTDNIPVRNKHYPSNWELSVARAYSVIEFLVNECGLSPSRFVTAGYGEFRPVAPNNTEAGRAMNRRIEINILRKNVDIASTAPKPGVFSK